MEQIEQIKIAIKQHKTNQLFTKSGLKPLFIAHPEARIVIVGQAPGLKAQTSQKPWDDASGLRLMNWLGVDEQEFRSPELFAHIPMDFYYPGKSKSGDLPPRKDFARLWHPQLLACMPQVKLTVLIGRYAQSYYLKHMTKHNLTHTVHSYQDYLPDYFPLVHPSPLNFRWFIKNPWFEETTVPRLRQEVRKIISK